MNAILASAEPLDVFPIVVGVLGGLSLFLFGMSQLTDALKAVAGARMRDFLHHLTRNRFRGALTGIGLTAVLQSSSLTTVLVVGFVSAGLMTLVQATPVIMGASVGSTVTAQIIAFKISDYALLLVTIGFLAQFLGRRDVVQQIGAMVMGLGLIFFGMGLMSDATVPLRDFPPFIEAMKTMDNRLLAALAGAVFTAIVQSSSATIGIVIVLAGQGFLSLEAGVAIGLGAKVGSCVTAILSALGRPTVALQTAMVHVLFNTSLAVLGLLLLDPLAEVARSVSPAYADLEGAERLAAEVPRQVANAITLAAFGGLLTFIGFTPQLAGLVERMIPAKPEPKRPEAEPRFLDDIYLKTPDLAVDRIRLEVGHLGEVVTRMVEGTMASSDGKAFNLERLQEDAADAESLFEAIVDYARRLLERQRVPSSRVTAETENLLEAATHLSSIADTLRLSLPEFTREWRERSLSASPETGALFGAFLEQVLDAVRDATQAVATQDGELATSVVTRKRELLAQADVLARRLSDRLTADAPERLATYRLESRTLELFKRVYYFAKRAAKTVSEEADEADVPLDEAD